MKTLEPWVGNGLYSFCIFQLYIIFKLKKYRQLCIKLVWLIPVLNWFRINFDTLTSVPIFSTLFFIHFVWYRQGEFVKQSKPLRVLIISFILMILIDDSVVLLKGENRCWSLKGFRGVQATRIVASSPEKGACPSSPPLSDRHPPWLVENGSQNRDCLNIFSCTKLDALLNIILKEWNYIYVHHTHFKFKLVLFFG